MCHFFRGIMDKNKIHFRNIDIPYMCLRRSREQILKRKTPFEYLIVIYYIDGMHPSDMLSLFAYLSYTSIYPPVFIDLDKLLSHKSSRGISIIAEKVYDILCVFLVLNMRENLRLSLLGKFGNQVGCIVRIQFLQVTGYLLVGEVFKNVFQDLFIHLSKGLRRLFTVEQTHQVSCFFQFQFAGDFGNISKVKALKVFLELLLLIRGY